MHVVAMTFVTGCGCGGDEFCGQLWVAEFNVALCLVVVVAMIDGAGFLWPIAWVGLLGFCDKEEVRKKLINK